MYLLILEWAASIGTIEFAAKAGKIAWTSDKWLYIVATGTIEFAAKAGKIAWTSDKCCMQQKSIVPSQRSLSCELQYDYLCSK